MGSFVSNITGNLFGKSPKPSQSSSGFGALPSDIQEGYRTDIIQRGQDIAGSPDAFQPIAYDPRALQAINTQLGGLRQGVDYMRPDFKFGQQANRAFGQAGDMYNMASSYLGQAMPYVQQSADYTRQGASPITGQEIQSSISDFMNPYTESVVNQTMQDMNRFASGAFSDARGMIGDYGASGSNRERLLMSDIASKILQDTARQTSALRQSGFESAAGRALNRLQGDRGNALTGAGLAINQAGTVQNQAGQAAGIGGNLANLGGQYLQGRALMNDITNSNYNRALGGLQNQIAAGDLLRAQEAQTQGIPIEQLRLLQGLYNPLLSASNSVGERPEDTGLLGRISTAAGNFFGGGGNSASAGVSKMVLG